MYIFLNNCPIACPDLNDFFNVIASCTIMFESSEIKHFL